MKKLIFVSIIIFLIAPNIIAQTSGCISGNCQDGYGTYVWGYDTDWAGDKYTGYWKDGYRHGQGTYQYGSGAKYTGNYSYNQMEGFGKFTWTSGESYEGSWVDDKQHGTAIYTYADGSSIKGIWENGTYVREVKEETGCISGDCDDGYGTFTWKSGEKYEGYWYGGKRSGQGTNIYASGNVFSGGWKADQQHGQGTMTYANGIEKTAQHVSMQMEINLRETTITTKKKVMELIHGPMAKNM